MIKKRNIRSNHQRWSVKKGVLKNFPKFTGKHLHQSLFFNKVADLIVVQLYWKRDSDTTVFFWILGNFQEHLFYRTHLGDCFCDMPNDEKYLLFSNFGWSLRAIICMLCSDNASTNWEVAKLYRSRRPEVFCKRDVLKNFTKLIGKQLCQSFFFNKVAGLRPSTLLEKRLWYCCFLENFVKFSRTPFLTEHLRWLFLALNEQCYYTTWG